MHEMTPHRQSAPATFLPPQQEYAQITDLATRLAGTAFVPSGLRNDDGTANAPAVLAAMLTGRELGLAPMESLRSIHMIEGKPTLSAEATMKLAQEAGNLLIVTETTAERATVKYRNAAWPDDEPARTLTFDLEDAATAGLTRRPMWSKYPRAMLRSRAITEAARAGGLLTGAALAYTAEELDEPDESVAVLSMSPDVDDEAHAAEVETELEVRRGLYHRARDAYNAMRALDEGRTATAWAALGAGLADDLWQAAPVDVLTIRVSDLERAAADLAAEHTDDDDGEGGTPTDPDPDGDAGDGTDQEPADDDEVLEDDGDSTWSEPDTGTHGDPPAPATPSTPDVDPAVALLRRAYPAMNVTDVSDLLRKGSATVKVDARQVEVTLPRGGSDGVFDAYRLVAELEAEHHGTDKQPTGRRTVTGILPETGPPRDADTSTDGEDDPAGGSGSDDARGAQEAVQRAAAADGRSHRELLEDWHLAHDEIATYDEGRAGWVARRRAETVGDASDERWLAWDRETLVELTLEAEALARALADAQ